ncbi:MAG TPA: hypothetical protein VF461_05220 [Gemmatimonadaceae bacterium]
MAARGIVAWLLAGVIATGCREPTAPHASLSVAVVSDPIPGSSFVGGAPNWNTFSVDVVVRNESDVAAEIAPCGPQLEYESPAGEWIADASRMCALGGGGTIELPPRSERQWRETLVPPPLTVTGSPAHVRLLYWYATVGVSGLADEARSGPIELK